MKHSATLCTISLKHVSNELFFSLFQEEKGAPTRR
uniref:Uncharacterized protein n=1 Tax=Arundo donax TaxID=35708 RepID=A0A0A8YNX8_ARUDO